jgi:hypothetical protein
VATDPRPIRKVRRARRMVSKLALPERAGAVALVQVLAVASVQASAVVSGEVWEQLPSAQPAITKTKPTMTRQNRIVPKRVLPVVVHEKEPNAVRVTVREGIAACKTVGAGERAASSVKAAAFALVLRCEVDPVLGGVLALGAVRWLVEVQADTPGRGAVGRWGPERGKVADRHFVVVHGIDRWRAVVRAGNVDQNDHGLRVAPAGRTPWDPLAHRVV